MTIQQLQYILAIEEHGSFSRAAEAQFISQPALSMMVQKLEDELDLKIFDRNKKPILPTADGQPILNQARLVLREIDKLHEIRREQMETLQGHLSIGIIPTLAPYLLPLFLNKFLKKHPSVHLKIYEYTTENIVEHLKKGNLDVGLLVTLCRRPSSMKHRFFMSAFSFMHMMNMKKITSSPKISTLTSFGFWEEGHCLRSQILNLCELRKKSNAQLEFEAGSIDTLIKMVEHHSGITIVPELATLTMYKRQKKYLRPFAPPVPVREVSIVTHRDLVKRSMVEALRETVLENLPKEIAREEGEARRVPIG